MSEEQNEKKCCFVIGEGFKKFLTLALGTFVGVYLAMGLLFNVYRPVMIYQNIMPFSDYASYDLPCKKEHKAVKKAPKAPKAEAPEAPDMDD